MRTLLVLGWMAALVPPFPQDAASEITGSVRFSGSHEPQKLNDKIDKDKHGGPHRDVKDVVDETVIVGAKGELANILVRVKNPPKKEFAAAADTLTLDAADYQFRPRVLVVRPGQTVTFKNSGFDNFNFITRPLRNREFNLGLVRGGAHDAKFTEVEVGIKVHHLCCPWQVAWIHVIDHPYFAVTGADGTFKIKDLPGGTYDVEIWHEKFGVKSASVKIGDKETKAQDFVFDPPAK